jgi:hypothetical protein
MDVYERSRHELHQRLQEAIGPEAASTLMAHLQPGGIDRLATKDDIQRLELKIDATRQELRAEMHQLGRNLMLSMTTVMALLLGIMFAALQVSG